jgi:serine/threonine-protein kinase
VAVADELAPGTLVGGAWLVEATRAAGGFARLYRARHVSDGRVAALKVLHRRHVDSASALRRFQREAETLARLSHPAIVTVWGSGELTDGRPWIAMAWLEGEDLGAALARRGPLPLAETVALARALAAPLQAAHAAGVVHRDLKAENVMLGAGGAVTLVDFGVAKLAWAEAGGGATTATVLGTPLSMAPEQILLRPVDARADVYALGLLVYRALTGRHAFVADDAVELTELHLSAPPPRASAHAPVPEAVDAVIRRCLAKAPDDRFAGVIEAVDALAAAARAAGAGARTGVHVEVQVPADGDDAAWDEAERVCGALRAALEACGLGIGVDGGGTLSAAGAVDGDAVARAVGAAVGGLGAVRLPVTVSVRVGDDVDRPAAWAAPPSEAPGVRIVRR